MSVRVCAKLNIAIELISGVRAAPGFSKEESIPVILILLRFYYCCVAIQCLLLEKVDNHVHAIIT